MKEKKVFFKPKARLVEILGEHLIRDDTVGIIELIKNSYDADAENVQLEISNTKNKERTVIIVEDDGIGMDSGIVEGRWMEPAHGAKDEEKKKNIKTKKDRIPLGEKGVGRFAAQKIGRTLELISRPEGKDYEICVKINWDDFEDRTKYINEVPVIIKERKPQYFKDKKKHGTLIKISDAREQWTRNNLERLQASLIRLLSPGVVDENFEVHFFCRDHPDLENLDRSNILERFQFKIECEIDEKGKLEYKYFEREPRDKVIDKKDTYKLWEEVRNKNNPYRQPGCGSLKVTIYAWLRDSQNLKNYKVTGAQLQELSGINVFRDGFRVLPYGDSGDDWLKLDDRRVNNPSATLGNRQVIGFVELNQEINKKLVDKTNREGLQENKAFFDMKKLVLGCISKLEQEHVATRKELTKKTPSPKKKVEQSFAELKKEHDELKKKFSELKVEKESEEKDGFVKVSVEQLSKYQEKKEELDNKWKEYDEKYNATYNEIKEVLGSDEEKRKVFLHLINVGMASERFVHEFDRMVSGMSKAVEKLQKKYGNDMHIQELDVLLSSLKNEVILMGATRYTKRTPEERKTSVNNVFRLMKDIYEETLQEENISIEVSEGRDLITRIPDYYIAQIFNNILSNFIYWVSAKHERNDRKIRIYIDEDKNEVLLTNNGPGILPNVKSKIFHAPFVTGKSSENPRGLGMYIAAEILKLYKGKIRIITSQEDNRVLNTGFLIYLPPRD